MKTINMTPTWTALVPIITHILRNATPKSIQDTTSELTRLAKGVDAALPSIRPDGYPSWERSIPDYIAAIQDGSMDEHNAAMAELTRLAGLADEILADQKANQPTV